MLEKIKKQVTLSQEEDSAIKSTIKEFNSKIGPVLSENKIEANIFVGGSVGKGSNLPGLHDIDIFVRFKEDGEISEMLQTVLESCFKKIVRLKGSRDYFKVDLNGFEIEVVPVLYITRSNQAKNITDHSPFHVNWSKRKSTNLVEDVKISKQFFRGIGAYGAESWIGGFSGHVIEILTVNYGGFKKLLTAISKWGDTAFADVEKHYSNEKLARASISESKQNSPLLVIDPVDKERNAAAAVTKEKYDFLRAEVESFLKKPKLNSFEELVITDEDIKKLVKKNKLYLFSAKPESPKLDASGAKMLNHYKKILRMFTENNFELIDSGFFWDKKNDGLIWFILNPKELSKKHILKGPPTYESSLNIMKFKEKYKRRKIWREGYNYFVEVSRKYTKTNQIIRLVKAEEEFNSLTLKK